MSILGIDIGGSSVKAAVRCPDGQWMTTISGWYRDPDRTTILRSIGECLDVFGQTEWTSIGLCLPGRMNRERNAIERSVNIPSLDGWMLSDVFASLPGVPSRCRAVSDADAAGFDWVSDHPSTKRTAVLSLGTGVGLCVLDGAEIVTLGQRGIGHLGHMDVGRLGGQDRIGRDGSRNTLELYIGAPSLSAWSVGEGLDLLGLNAPDAPIQALVRALRVVHAIYQPDQVALLGGVGLALTAKRELIYEMVNDGLTPLAVTGWTLACGDSGYHAARGAAKLAAYSMD